MNYSFPLSSGATVNTDPDPLVVGRDGALVCSTQVDTSSIQWVDSDDEMVLAEGSTGGQTLELPLGVITDTLNGTRYTCIVTSTGADPLILKKKMLSLVLQVSHVVVRVVLLWFKIVVCV